jgi:hypothetical protein
VATGRLGRSRAAGEGIQTPVAANARSPAVIVAASDAVRAPGSGKGSSAGEAGALIVGILTAVHGATSQILGTMCGTRIDVFRAPFVGHVVEA